MRLTNDELKLHKQQSTHSIQSGTQSPSIDIKLIEELIEKGYNKVRQETKDEISKQIQNDKISLITIFGIFASITSFLTIEFQFLKTVNSLEKILGFSFILFALLLGFNIALDYIVKSRSDKDTIKPNIYFCAVISILFIIGVIAASRGNEEHCKDNFIYQRYADDFENRLIAFHQSYKQQLRDLDTAIKKLAVTTKHNE